eukprot:scaffold1878_cov355-Prasinococcus_capsulatus_cf.AAC.6
MGGDHSKRACLGVQGAMVVTDAATVAGWANVDVDCVGDRHPRLGLDPGSIRWGIMASPAPNGHGRWGFMCGSIAGAGCVSEEISNGGKTMAPALHYEGFLRITDSKSRVGLIPGTTRPDVASCWTYACGYS